MLDFVTLDADGTPRVDLRRAKEEGKGHLIAALVPTKYGLSIRLEPRTPVLSLLAKYHDLANTHRVVVERAEEDHGAALIETVRNIARAAQAARERQAALGTADRPIEVLPPAGIPGTASAHLRQG
jgi:hypothetical protein